MSFFRARSGSAGSNRSLQMASPLRLAIDEPTDILGLYSLCHGQSKRALFHDQLFRSDSELFWADDPSMSFDKFDAFEIPETTDTFSDVSPNQRTIYESAHSYDACMRTDVASYESDFTLSDDDIVHLEQDRPWEKVPLEELNHLPPQFDHWLQEWGPSSIRLGVFRSLLRFYILQVVGSLSLPLPEAQNLHRSISDKGRVVELVQFAEAVGLFPLALRLHLEASGQIEMPASHALFVQFKRDRQRQRMLARQDKSKTIERQMSLGTNGQCEIAYYPGIELKLGKERDTLIRPMLTAVFRNDKDAFKTALLGVGLKYGELRMWKDCQLCSAIYVADRFKPGVWRTAVDLHLNKTARKRSRSRRRVRRADSDSFSSSAD